MLLVGNKDRAPIGNDGLSDGVAQLQIDLRTERLMEFPADLLRFRANLYFLLDGAKEINVNDADMTGKMFYELCIKLWVQFREVPEMMIQKGNKQRSAIIEQLHRVLNDESTKLQSTNAFKHQNITGSLMCQLSELSTMLSEVDIKWYDQNKRRKLKTFLIKEATLIFSTVNYGGSEWLKYERFDVALVDEASQLLQPETAILIKPNLQCLILAGDDKQLPPTVSSIRNSELGYGESLMGRLLAHNYPHSFLNVQYRMHPEISYWPSAQFYEGNLINGENVTSPVNAPSWRHLFHPLVIYNVTAGKDERTEHGSFYNELEVRIVRNLLNNLRFFQERITIGVISPYAAQVAELKNLERMTADKKLNVDIRVSTVDGFQGQECDVIIFSAVRSNDNNKIGFLSDQRRLNVAMTRAKHSVFVICNTFTVSNNHCWRALIDYSKSIGRFANGKSSQIIQKAESKWMKQELRLKQFGESSYVNLFRDSPWIIEFSHDFQRSMQAVAANRRNALLRKIVALAAGEWPRYEMKNSAVPEEFAEMIHVLHVEVYRLVWSVDIKHTLGKQYIRIWDVCSGESDVPHALKKAVNKSKHFSQDYIRGCSIRKKHPTENIYIPDCIQVAGFVWFDASSSLDVADSMEEVQVSSSAALTKFFTLEDKVAKLLFSNIDLSKIELPFVLSDEEESLIRQDASLIILGRSGTGKIIHPFVPFSLVTTALFSCRQNDCYFTQDVLIASCRPNFQAAAGDIKSDSVCVYQAQL
jgi:hypothetical protein